MTYKKLLGAASIIGALAAGYLHHQATNVNVWEHKYKNWFVTVAQTKSSGLQYTEMKGINHPLYNRISGTKQDGKYINIAVSFLEPSLIPVNCVSEKKKEFRQCTLDELAEPSELLLKVTDAALQYGKRTQ